jgi:hypothetical protein
MPDLVTIAQANAHLRLDLAHDGGSPLQFTDDRVPDLELKIEQAQSIVIDYLGAPADVLDGSPPAYATSSPPLWSARDIKVIQSAILLVLSALFDDD